LRPSLIYGCLSEGEGECSPLGREELLAKQGTSISIQGAFYHQECARGVGRSFGGGRGVFGAPGENTEQMASFEKEFFKVKGIDGRGKLLHLAEEKDHLAGVKLELEGAQSFTLWGKKSRACLEGKRHDNGKEESVILFRGGRLKKIFL